MGLSLAMVDGAIETLGSLPQKMRAQVIKKIRALLDDPHPPGSKKLSGVDRDGFSVYRERSGDYRILYLVTDVELLVLDVDDRKDVYRGSLPKTSGAPVDNAKLETIKDGRPRKPARKKAGNVVAFPDQDEGRRTG